MFFPGYCEALTALINDTFLTQVILLVLAAINNTIVKIGCDQHIYAMFFLHFSLFQQYVYTNGGMRHMAYTCICGT